jgi:aspartyl-tRNA(Asn)/glutamyl-tRNA(Gln) amidotransferase subunit C
MAVTREDVLRIADLARIELRGDEIERLTTELNSILVNMEALEEVTIPPDLSPMMLGEAAPLRDDVVAPDPLSLPLQRLAPAWEDGFFTVPRLSALDQDEAEERTP